MLPPGYTAVHNSRLPWTVLFNLFCFVLCVCLFRVFFGYFCVSFCCWFFVVVFLLLYFYCIFFKLYTSL